jgi:hypothetical protein
MADDTTDPVSSYVLNYLNALKAMDRAKAKLEKMANDISLSEPDRAAAGSAFLDMSEKTGRLKAAHAAFMAAHQPGVNPPSNAVVAKSGQLADALAKVIAKAKESSAILDAVTQFVTDWSQLAGQPAAAAAAPQGASTADWLAAHNTN